MKSRVHIYVFGVVQGVFFRANTQEQASMLGITGWVKNKSDGSVEIVAEGEKGQLDALVQWTKHGPSTANVTKHQYIWEEYKNEFKNFEIRY